MVLEKWQLARIPIAPRAKLTRPLKKRYSFVVSRDAAVKAIARMIVAGVDKKHYLYPYYSYFAKTMGKEKLHEYIERNVTAAGAVDIMQTDMSYAGVGLFGGLTKDESKFQFYEWISVEYGQLTVSMTANEARDIVSGKKKKIVFKRVSRAHR